MYPFSFCLVSCHNPGIMLHWFQPIPDQQSPRQQAESSQRIHGRCTIKYREGQRENPLVLLLRKFRSLQNLKNAISFAQPACRNQLKAWQRASRNHRGTPPANAYNFYRICYRTEYAQQKRGKSLALGAFFNLKTIMKEDHLLTYRWQCSNKGSGPNVQFDHEQRGET